MGAQFQRRASLLVVRPGQQGNNPSAFAPEQALDLSQLQFQFKTAQQDEEGPSNCQVRVFNLSGPTRAALLTGEFSRLVLQAGYGDSFGVIFDGDIKQFRTGRLNATDTYVDLLAADGDMGYNFAVASGSVAAGSPKSAQLKVALDAFKDYGVTLGADLSETGGTLPRGKVLFGMARTFVRNIAESRGCTWSIQNGKIQIVPLDGYLPGEAVKLSAATGLVGVPEQTTDGVKARCLLNPRIVVGGRVQIDNRSVNQTLGVGQPTTVGQIPFNQWAAPQFLADVTRDGFYRVYVAEHEGDTRGQAWYTNIVCLAVDQSTGKVKPYG